MAVAAALGDLSSTLGRVVLVAVAAATRDLSGLLLGLLVLVVAVAVAGKYSARARERAARAGEIPYSEGPVWEMTFIKTEYGRQREYERYLAGPWKQIQEEAKKQGLITAYYVLRTIPSDSSDWNMILVTEALNLAALDAVEAKWDAIGEKVAGAEEKRSAEAVKRSEVRKIVGGKMLRELLLK